MRAAAIVALRGLLAGAAFFGVTVAALGGASAQLVAVFWVAGVLATLVRDSRRKPTPEPVFAPLLRRRIA